MREKFQLNRMEIAGSIGDLGTLLPILIAMVLINGLQPLGLFLSIGSFYVLSGLFFGVPVPVQPMKVIGSYAIVMSLNQTQILASTLLMGIFLLIIGLTGSITVIQKYTPKAVIRGIQLSTGILLLSGGIKMIMGISTFQKIQNAAEPYLLIQNIGPVPIGLLLGTIGGLVTLLFIDSKRFPSGLVVIIGGLFIGLLLGTHAGFDKIDVQFYWPEFFAFPFPQNIDFSFALLTLVLPQLPMTMGNAILAYTDLSKKYFNEKSIRVTNKNACLSMAFANLFSFCLGGMPLCHGAGGLAAHYRFGARTVGSNLFIGILFILLALFLGNHIITIVTLLPMSVLGILLMFAGLQLALTIMDLETRQDFFVAMMILGITLASNMAAGFIAGIVIAHVLKWKKLSI